MTGVDPSTTWALAAAGSAAAAAVWAYSAGRAYRVRAARRALEDEHLTDPGAGDNGDRDGGGRGR